MGLGSGLRRALFMRSVRKAQEEPPGGGAPPVNLRVRYALRLLLRDSDKPWPLPTLSYTVLISQPKLYELGTTMSMAGLAEVIWFEGKRSIRLTELGMQEVPNILSQYRSQRLIVILFRDGPRAAGYAWVTRRRDRAWRRAMKHGENAQELEAKANELDVLE